MSLDELFPLRRAWPRRLIVWDNIKSRWFKCKDESVLQQIKYVAISYRQADWKRSDLERCIRPICGEILQSDTPAYWLDVACMGPDDDELEYDLYRMADVFRYADQTLVAIQDTEDGWLRWGERVWTLPEALLSSQNLNYVIHGKTTERNVKLSKVANLAYQRRLLPDEWRLLDAYETKEPLTVAERMRLGYIAIWNRTIGFMTEGKIKGYLADKVYALMGLFDDRIRPDSREDESTALNRLMEANRLRGAIKDGDTDHPPMEHPNQSPPRDYQPAPTVIVGPPILDDRRDTAEENDRELMRYATTPEPDERVLSYLRDQQNPPPVPQPLVLADTSAFMDFLRNSDTDYHGSLGRPSVLLHILNAGHDDNSRIMLNADISDRFLSSIRLHPNTSMASAGIDPDQGGQQYATSGASGTATSRRAAHVSDDSSDSEARHPVIVIQPPNGIMTPNTGTRPLTPLSPPGTLPGPYPQPGVIPPITVHAIPRMPSPPIIHPPPPVIPTPRMPSPTYVYPPRIPSPTFDYYNPPIPEVPRRMASPPPIRHRSPPRPVSPPPIHPYPSHPGGSHANRRPYPERPDFIRPSAPPPFADQPLPKDQYRPAPAPRSESGSSYKSSKSHLSTLTVHEARPTVIVAPPPRPKSRSRPVERDRSRSNSSASRRRYSRSASRSRSRTPPEVRVTTRTSGYNSNSPVSVDVKSRRTRSNSYEVQVTVKFRSEGRSSRRNARSALNTQGPNGIETENYPNPRSIDSWARSVASLATYSPRHSPLYQSPEQVGLEEELYRLRARRPTLIFEDSGRFDVAKASSPRILKVRGIMPDTWLVCEDEQVLASVEYLVCSYSHVDFQNRALLEQHVQFVCNFKGINAYWIDFLCSDTSAELKRRDLFSMSDIYRGAKLTVIIIGGASSNASWNNWSRALWSLPAALLSQRLMVYDIGGELKNVDLNYVRDVAFTNSEEARQLFNAYTSNQSSPLADRVNLLRNAFWKHSDKSLVPIAQDTVFGEYSAERVYTIMGFMQFRIQPTVDEGERDAWKRLMEANGLDIRYVSSFEANGSGPQTIYIARESTVDGRSDSTRSIRYNHV